MENKSCLFYYVLCVQAKRENMKHSKITNFCPPVGCDEVIRILKTELNLARSLLEIYHTTFLNFILRIFINFILIFCKTFNFLNLPQVDFMLNSNLVSEFLSLHYNPRTDKRLVVLLYVSYVQDKERIPDLKIPLTETTNADSEFINSPECLLSRGLIVSIYSMFDDLKKKEIKVVKSNLE